MWKVKRMNTARIVVLTIAVGAGGVAAYLASGSDSKPPPAEPVAQLQTVDVLVAKSDIGLGQTVTLKRKPEQTSILAGCAPDRHAVAGAAQALPTSEVEINGPTTRLATRQHQRGSLRIHKPDHDTEVTKRT